MDTLSPLEVDELAEIVKELHQTLNLNTIRLTGGEPTLFPKLTILIEKIADLGIPVKMTTNAFHAEKISKNLSDAGLKAVNISLDALNEEVFQKISKRKNLQKVLNNIEDYLASGIETKLNSVIVNGVNSCEIIPLLEYAQKLNVPIRFLELMKMGHLFSSGHDQYFISENDILQIIKSKYNFIKNIREAHATAHYFTLDNGYKFGLISNESEPFCDDCDRLRLDIYGNIYGCLSSNTPINIAKLQKSSALDDALENALLQKQKQKFSGSTLSMMAIGG